MENKLIFGIAEEKITPKIGGNLFGYTLDVISNAVNDDLTATAYYFSDGKTEAFMISLTVCVITADVAWRLRSEIEKMTGVSADHILIHATHTHSGPSTANTPGFGIVDSEYMENIFVPSIKKAAIDAKNCAEPVTMAVSQGESRVGVNRRELSESNEILLGQNPWAPCDLKMTVISFKNNAGEVTGSIVHYGCHGTAAGRNHEISRDWPGVMVDSVSEYGGGICAFFNGPEGDVGPRLMNGQTTGGNANRKRRLVMAALDHGASIEAAMEHGAIAANDAVRIFKQHRVYHDATLTVSKKYIKVPVEPRIPLDIAKAEYEKYKDCTVNQLGGLAAYLKDVIKSYEEGYEDKEFYEVEQIIVKIGEVAFVSFSFELFSEIGLRIQKHSPIPYTLSLSNTNDTGGYFPTQSDICRGGYEVTMFKQKNVQPYADDGDIHVIRETLTHLRSIED